jgi:hypothetical protein
MMVEIREMPNERDLQIAAKPARIPAVAAVAVSVGLSLATPAMAVEGGIGAYFMGTRDTLAGIVPPPGTYLSFSYDYMSGSVEGVSISGTPIRAETEVELNLFRVGITQAFEAQLFGGTPAVNVTLPFPDIGVAFTGVTPPLDGARVEGETFGLGDIAVSGLIGWHKDKLHYSTGLSIYAPTGDYAPAKVDLANRTIDNLANTSKNVWSFQPFFAATWLNPDTGLELSGAVSFLFSTKNDATDYQTAPAVQLEGAVVQSIKSGWGFGLSAYHYEQTANDSGSGAEQTQEFLGLDSLRARVSGIGPIVTYSGGQLFGGDVSLRAKYVNEFNAKRRFESDIFTLSLSLAF